MKKIFIALLAASVLTASADPRYVRRGFGVGGLVAGIILGSVFMSAVKSEPKQETVIVEQPRLYIQLANGKIVEWCNGYKTEYEISSCYKRLEQQEKQPVYIYRTQ